MPCLLYGKTVDGMTGIKFKCMFLILSILDVLILKPFIQDVFNACTNVWFTAEI